MSETIKLHSKNRKISVQKAVAVLKKKGVIIFPTETSYGIGANALNSEAVSKVHSAKQQPENKPISVICSDLKQIKKIAKLDKEALALAKKFFPGPLTIIAEQKSIAPKNLTQNGIAFRIPSNKFARELCKAFGKPITATSANIHGEPAIFDSKEAIEKFFGKIDLIIDAGKLPETKASTIYSTIEHRIIREGPINEEEIHKILKKKNKK